MDQKFARLRQGSGGQVGEIAYFAWKFMLAIPAHHSRAKVSARGFDCTFGPLGTKNLISATT
jgi:hypothetical protein